MELEEDPSFLRVFETTLDMHRKLRLRNMFLNSQIENCQQKINTLKSDKDQALRTLNHFKTPQHAEGLLGVRAQSLKHLIRLYESKLNELNLHMEEMAEERKTLNIQRQKVKADMKRLAEIKYRLDCD